jgi:hypothetical protein
LTTCLRRQQDPGLWPCRRGETRTCAVRDPWRNERRRSRRRRKRNEEEEETEGTPKQEEEVEEREEERECTACPHNPAGEREESQHSRPHTREERTRIQGLILERREQGFKA